MSGKDWTEAELTMLREFFPGQRWSTILTSLPGRTRGAINQQARILGIHREVNKRAKWTAIEEGILRRMWPVADEPEIVAAFPERRFATIGKKASALGLRRRLPGARKNGRFIQPVIVALRLERERQRLTRPQLSKKIGYHWMQIHIWEMGKACPIFAKLVDWAEALGMEIVLRPTAAKILEEKPFIVPKSRLMAGR